MTRENKESIWRAKERINTLNDRLARGIMSYREYIKEYKKEEDLIKKLSKGEY